MRPAPFSYTAPASLEEALAALDDAPTGVRVLAGGQSLVPALRLREIRPPQLIDINGVHELDYLERSGDRVRIGALTRQRVARERGAPAGAPLLSAALNGGFSAVQARGTVGGAIVQADPAGDLPLVLVTLDGEVDAHSRRAGVRTVAAHDLYRGTHLTALAADELVTEIRLAAHDADTFAHEKATAGVGSWRAIVSTAVVLQVADGVACRAAVGIGGAGAMPVRSAAAEQVVQGHGLDADSIDAAAQAAAADCVVRDDDGVSRAYRRQLVRVLVRRALTRAWGARR